MLRNRARALCILLALIMTLGLASTALANQSLYILRDTVVYDGPGSKHMEMGTLEAGERVAVTGYSLNGWRQVRYGKTIMGYVKGEDLSHYKPAAASVSAVAADSGEKAAASSAPVFWVDEDRGDIYYATGRVNVRTGPGTGYARVGKLTKNQQVTRIGEKDGWYKLLTADGSSAYAIDDYLEPVNKPSLPTEDKNIRLARICLRCGDAYYGYNCPGCSGNGCYYGVYDGVAAAGGEIKRGGEYSVSRAVYLYGARDDDGKDVGGVMLPAGTIVQMTRMDSNGKMLWVRVVDSSSGDRDYDDYTGLLFPDDIKYY